MKFHISKKYCNEMARKYSSTKLSVYYFCMVALACGAMLLASSAVCTCLWTRGEAGDALVDGRAAT
jgi:hypothetical protein